MVRVISHKWCGMAFLLMVMTSSVCGHPLPEVLVRGFFGPGREAKIEVEIDPRSFVRDPLNEPYLLHADLKAMAEVERARLPETAQAFVEKAVAFYFEPAGRFVPRFDFHFTAVAGAELEDPGDPVMLTGRWKTTLAPEVTGYRVEALPGGLLSVVVRNEIAGRPAGREQVLFPREASKVLDLTDGSRSPPKAITQE